MDETTRIDYLLENFRNAREELLFRVKHRDDWLKIQLLAQAALLALAQGIELNGIKAATPQPLLLTASPVISLILAALYYVEDNLIGYLSRYIGAISEAEMKLRQGHFYISNWDTSKPLREYAKGTRRLRLVAQVAAFVIMPLSLTAIRMMAFPAVAALPWIELIANGFILLIISFILCRGYILRRQTGQIPAYPVLIETTATSTK